MFKPALINNVIVVIMPTCQKSDRIPATVWLLSFCRTTYVKRNAKREATYVSVSRLSVRGWSLAWLAATTAAA